MFPIALAECVENSDLIMFISCSENGNLVKGLFIVVGL
jgi:hypothetical protein